MYVAFEIVLKTLNKTWTLKKQMHE